MEVQVSATQKSNVSIEGGNADQKYLISEVMIKQTVKMVHCIFHCRCISTTTISWRFKAPLNSFTESYVFYLHISKPIKYIITILNTNWEEKSFSIPVLSHYLLDFSL